MGKPVSDNKVFLKKNILPVGSYKESSNTNKVIAKMLICWLQKKTMIFWNYTCKLQESVHLQTFFKAQIVAELVQKVQRHLNNSFRPCAKNCFNILER